MIPAGNCRTSSLGPITLPSVIICSSSDETCEQGQKLGKILQKGDIVALTGPLGAGKTCFARGIALGVGVNEEICSPTYSIVSEHRGFSSNGNVIFYHIDAYRLRGDDDFINIGGEEILFTDGISVIEWSERIPAFIPPYAYNVDIEIIEDGKRLLKLYRDTLIQEKK